MDYVIRAFVRSLRLKVRCHYPIVNYCLLFAASAPRESIKSIVKSGSICPQIASENSVDPHSELDFWGNPLEKPPLEIAKKGIEAIRDYFAKLDTELLSENRSELNETPAVLSAGYVRAISDGFLRIFAYVPDHLAPNA